MPGEKKIWNGINGELWLNNTDKLVKIQKFTFKQTNQYEKVDTTDSVASQQRLIGVELSGEITKYKTDFKFNEIMERYANGIQPDVSLIGKVTNPDTGETKRISITDITLGDMDLFAFEKGKTTQDVIPFNAGDYEYL